MPATLTYPGVYIEEIPSGVRTIVGVSTSIAAFVGWAARGPTDRAQRILSFQDFVRFYGGLDRRSLLGYSVQQFFANGGQDAYIVRLHADDAVAATIAAALNGSLEVEASSPGAWGNDYSVRITVRSDDANRFQLAVLHTPTTGPTVVLETFDNLSLAPDDRRFVDSVVNAASAFVRTHRTAAGPLTASTTALQDGDDGTVLVPNDGDFETALLPAAQDSGVYRLDRVDLFNLLCVPGLTPSSDDSSAAIGTLQGYCRDHRAFYLVDAPEDADLADMQDPLPDALVGNSATNAALYFPWVRAADALQENRIRPFPPCGFVAGIYARTDSTRGIWKAPAGSEASVNGAVGVVTPLTDLENGTLNPRGINCIRSMPVYGTVVWGARTLHGADERGSEWKYVPVRRLALFLEETLFRNTQWVVFEPNDEPLWAQIRLNIGAFMNTLFRQGAFQGASPKEAYFVRCDHSTTTQNDIDRGVVNIVVGFAPLKPAEFVVIQIQQIAGQLQA